MIQIPNEEDIIRIHKEYDCYFSEMDTSTQDKLIKAICEKLTWLSNENATLHTQVDDDALKRAENTQKLLKIMRRSL